jgi:hypothetical protein
MTSTPLFLPVKAAYFEAFRTGMKTIEYRRGSRWNARTCFIGREVVLSCGYGTQRRLRGRITHFELSAQPPAEWTKIYDTGGIAACITIELDGN